MADTPRDVDKRIKSALSEVGVPKSKVILQQGGSTGISRRPGRRGPDSAEQDVASSMLTTGVLERHHSLLQENMAHLADRGLQVHCTKYGCGHSKVHDVIAIPDVKGAQHLKESKDACPSCRTS